MKKLFLSLVVAIIGTTATYAQSSMLATLSHEGEISTFYGAMALRDAYNASVDGDIITLSSGTFVSVDIKKGLTIRGAGMGFDTSSQTEPTIITGDFTINIPNESTSRLTIEGVYSNHTIYYTGTLQSATFIKDRLKRLDYSNSGTLNNATFVHCIITESLILASNSSASCINCFINDPYSYNGSTSNFEFVNCVIRYYSSIHSSSFKNCVIYTTSGAPLISSNTAYNCVGIGYSYLFDNMPNTTNVIVGFEEVFKSFTGTYYDNVSFELTDTAKETYKGIDGTEVGIYGGNMPFDPTPTNPQITKCNVASKSTADGKLSVDITVNGAE